MTITKIIEGTLIAGQSTITFTDSDIPNSILRVYPADSELIYESMTLSGTSLIVTYPVQSVNKAVALYIVKDGTVINDTLTSTSTSEALSANKGKALKDSLDTVSGDLATLSDTVAGLVIPDNITDLDDVNVTSIQDGQILAWDDVSEKFVNITPSSGGASFDYSEDEVICGTWIDGKTLYQKTIVNTSLTSISNGSWSTFATINNIESIAMASMGTRNASGHREYVVGNVTVAGGNNIVEVIASGNSVNSANGFILNIQYTKSS